MHPFSKSTVSAAVHDTDRVIEMLRGACRAKDADAWALISKALGHAANARAKLLDAMDLEDLADAAGVAEEEAAG
jgi:hypothetical protein